MTHQRRSRSSSTRKARFLRERALRS
jgi:hypothetical protein